MSGRVVAGDEVLLVRVRGETFGLPLCAVREVRRCDPLSPVPGVPGWVVGVQNVRGKVVAVVDLAAAFGLGAIPQPPATGGGSGRTSARRVICASGGVDVAIAVDAVDGVVVLDAEPVPPPDGLCAMLRAVCDGIADDGERLAAVLSPELPELLRARLVSA